MQDQVRKAQKQIAEENKRQAIKVTSEKADLAASNGKVFCISHVEVGLDVAAVREAVVKVMEQKVIADPLIMQLIFWASRNYMFFFLDGQLFGVKLKA